MKGRGVLGVGGGFVKEEGKAEGGGEEGWGRGVGKRGWKELWGGERGWRTVSAVGISVESGEMWRVFDGEVFWEEVLEGKGEVGVWRRGWRCGLRWKGGYLVKGMEVWIEVGGWLGGDEVMRWRCGEAERVEGRR